ncbi:MAG TPA: ester cyclase [Anaerolineales bacterium]|nr:ester cyclase [Anaerolineales bacterium]
MTAHLSAYAHTINEAWNSHNIENVLRFYSHECIGDDVGQASPLRGHDGLRKLLQTYWQAFPDLTFQVTGTIVEGRRLVIIWIAKGTHQGPIMNIPPTGRKLEIRGVSILDVQDGLIVRSKYIWDVAGMLRHMGLLPKL